MSELPGFEKALLRLADNRATDYNNHRRGQQKTLVDERLADLTAAIPVNDQTAPAAPTGVVVSPYSHALRVVWDAPPEEDYVAYSEVRATNTTTGAVETYTSVVRRITLDGLSAANPYTVEVRHIDRWGLVSGWVTGATGVAPDYTVAEYVDFAAARIAGTLGWANISALSDPTKLSNGVVTARAMAAQDAAAINLWVQNAAIQSAKIAGLAADKIDAGIIDAQIGISSGGYIAAGGARMDDRGVSLADVGIAFSPPADTRGSKITPDTSDSFGALHFWNANEAGLRGATLWGAGNAGGKAGAVRLVATETNTTGSDPAGPNSARVYLVSGQGGGRVTIGTDLYVDHYLGVGGGNVEVKGGGSLRFTNATDSTINSDIGDTNGVRIRATFVFGGTITGGAEVTLNTPRTTDFPAVTIYRKNAAGDFVPTEKATDADFMWSDPTGRIRIRNSGVTTSFRVRAYSI